MVIGTLPVCSHDAYALTDPAPIIHMLPYLAKNNGIEPKLLKSLAFTLVDECIQAKQVYKGCIVSIPTRITKIDIIELEMIDFHMIMGMNWVSSCYANVDCRAKIVRFSSQ